MIIRQFLPLRQYFKRLESWSHASEWFWCRSQYPLRVVTQLVSKLWGKLPLGSKSSGIWTQKKKLGVQNVLSSWSSKNQKCRKWVHPKSLDYLDLKIIKGSENNSIRKDLSNCDLKKIRNSENKSKKKIGSFKTSLSEESILLFINRG